MRSLLAGMFLAVTILASQPARAVDQSWSLRDVARHVKANDQDLIQMLGSAISGAQVAFGAMGHEINCQGRSSITLVWMLAEAMLSDRLSAKMRHMTSSNNFGALEAIGVFSSMALTTKCVFDPPLPKREKLDSENLRDRRNLGDDPTDDEFQFKAIQLWASKGICEQNDWVNGVDGGISHAAQGQKIPSNLQPTLLKETTRLPYFHPNLALAIRER